MSQEINIFGVAQVEFGAVGDGIMGIVLDSYTEIEVNSVVIEGENASQNTIPTEGNDAYVTLNDDVQPMTMTMRLFGVPVADYPNFMGGATVLSKWSAPKSKPNIFKSFRLTANALGGKVGVIEVPYGSVNCRIQGNITKNGLPALAVTLTANTPISAAQVEGAPYTVEFQNEV